MLRALCEGCAARWKALTGNGCTSAPDFTQAFTDCCNDHDRRYTLHADEDGSPLTRSQADAALLKCLHANGRTFVGRWLLAPLYYAAVRCFGGAYWRSDPAPAKLEAAASSNRQKSQA